MQDYTKQDWREARQIEQIYNNVIQVRDVSALEFIKRVPNLPMTKGIHLFLTAAQTGISVQWLKKRYAEKVD